MKQIKNYCEVSPLVSAQFRKGVRTNNFLSVEAYQAEIAQGSLYTHVWQGGLVFLRRRRGYWQLNFYLNDLSAPLDTDLNGIIVVEIPVRPKDLADDLLNYWKRQGFVHRFDRLRFIRPAGQAIDVFNSDIKVKKAEPSDCSALLDLMSECFDPITGCIPTQAELIGDINRDNVFCAKDMKAKICGLLHITRAASYTEIRHLAVREDMRGKHISRQLFSYYMNSTDFKKSLVWTSNKNSSAIRFYQSCGYTTDGWTSSVLVKGL
jgi:N-acetylglutamate synthase-like GNAT family acetyltransferase